MTFSNLTPPQASSICSVIHSPPFIEWTIFSRCLPKTFSLFSRPFHRNDFSFVVPTHSRTLGNNNHSLGISLAILYFDSSLTYWQTDGQTRIIIIICCHRFISVSFDFLKSLFVSTKKKLFFSTFFLHFIFEQNVVVAIFCCKFACHIHFSW